MLPPGLLGGALDHQEQHRLAGIATCNGSAAVADRPAAKTRKFTNQFVGNRSADVLGASMMPAFRLHRDNRIRRPPARSTLGHQVLVRCVLGWFRRRWWRRGRYRSPTPTTAAGLIRIPAAACPVWSGLKPSRPVAQAHESRSAPIDLISNGVVTRTVRDSAHFYADIERRFAGPGDAAHGLVEGPSDKHGCGWRCSSNL